MNTRMRGPYAGREHPLAVTRSLHEHTFRQRDIPALRRVATVFAASAGMGTAQLSDFVLAVSEAAACTVAQGPCTARLRLWMMGNRALCEISGDGVLHTDGLRIARPGDAETMRRWLLQRLCDHVSVRSGPHGVTVLFAMTVA